MLEEKDEALGALLLGFGEVEDDVVEQLTSVLQQVMASSFFFLFLPLLSSSPYPFLLLSFLLSFLWLAT